MERSDAFTRIWAAFDACYLLPSCAWCGRVRIDETWLFPSGAALAAIDQRYAFSHSVCDECADMLGCGRNANGPQPSLTQHPESRRWRATSSSARHCHRAP
jgi:hypothetical protein